MKRLILLICLSLAFNQELQVDGNLKVTGEIDAQGNAIKNVGVPTLTTDAANAQYLNERTAGKGRIITLKCPWISSQSWDISSCEPPSCPDGWNMLATYNEIISVSHGAGYGSAVAGNTVRYCMENEE